MGSINKKIRNATVVKSNKITFKSMLEKMCYNTLLEQGFNPQYEPFKIQLVDFADSKIPFYDKETDKQQEKRRLLLGKNSPKLLVLKSDKMQPITYTPDFYLRYMSGKYVIGCISPSHNLSNLGEGLPNSFTLFSC